MYWTLFLIKLQTLRPATLLKVAPRKVFSVECCKFFKFLVFAAFSIEHIWWLLLCLSEREEEESVEQRSEEKFFK